MKIYYTPKFKKNFKKLSRYIQETAIKKEKIFRKNPFSKSLKTHKLRGELIGLWSFSINYNYRIIFEFEDENVFFLNVGDHEIYS